MTAFRADLLTAVVAAGLFAAAAPSYAQTSDTNKDEPANLSPPTSLSPRQVSPIQPHERPRSLLRSREYLERRRLLRDVFKRDEPESNETPGETPAETSPETRVSRTTNSAVPGDVEVDKLGGIDPDSVGVLSEAEGGFGVDAWAGTDRELVEKMIPRLPAQATSPAMRDLMRRLLLTTAKVPAGAGERGSLLAKRIERLFAMGDADGVSRLLSAAPLRGSNKSLVRYETEMLFLNNDNGRACPLVTGQMQAASDPFWQKAFVFCQALAGEHSRAALGMDLLREMGESDPVYFGLVDSLGAKHKYQIASLTGPTPLILAVARAARAELPADVVSTDSPAILKTVATSPNARPELRLDAAERAEAMGAFPTSQLRQLYTAVDFSDDAKANPLATAAAERGPKSRALLYRKALVESVPAAQAEVLDAALKLAREGGSFQSSARVYHDILAKMTPSPDLIWFAPEAVRALLAVGDGPAATKWFVMLRENTAGNQEATATVVALTPLARLTRQDSAIGWNPAVLAKWWINEKAKAEKKGNVSDAVSRATLLYMLLDATGDFVPHSRWLDLLDDSPQETTLMPRPALWRAIGEAGEDGRIGETVMLVLTALGRPGPAQSDPLTLAHIITNLRKVNLDDEARALAVEAAVAAGI